MRIDVTQVNFTPTGADARKTGLLGWVTVVVNDALKIGGLTLRRTRNGRLTLSYPARRDGHGNMHHLVRPIDDDTRRDLERQVFKLLAMEITA